MKLTAPQPYYRIRLDPPPKALRIRYNRAENYQYYIKGKKPHVLEINYLLEGNICELRPQGEFCYEQGTVHTLVVDRPTRLYSTTPVMHELFLYVALAEPAEPISEEAVSSWVCNGNEAILPEYITDPALCRKIADRLKKCYESTGADPVQQLQLRACMYECMALVSGYAVSQAQARCKPERPVFSRYTKKACRYIEDHLDSKFTVTDVAQAAGISYNHLKGIFLKDTGMTIVEYTNNARIRMVQQLIVVDGTTLEEAGTMVGIPDPAYLSRLFRKHTGMSVRQYRRLQKQD